MTDAPLPHLLRQVADLAGLDAALRLARVRGGSKLNIPLRPTRAFVAEVGEAAAHALSRLYPGENVFIPLGPGGALRTARRIAGEALERGASTREAARLSGFTERTIYNLKSKAKDARQGRLFED